MLQFYLMLLIEATKTSSFLHIQLQGQIRICFCQNHIFANKNDWVFCEYVQVSANIFVQDSSDDNLTGRLGEYQAVTH